MSVSALILTFNEESNLPRCLASLTWCDDVVVLDSYSSDNTVDIAKSHGARVFQRKFDNYAAQRNFGLNDITYRHPWVLIVDADDEVPTELSKEITRVVESASEEICLFRLRRMDHLFGKWIRHSSGYPTWLGGLVRLGHGRFERAVNEVYTTNGALAYLDGHFNHYPFNKGFSAWFEKHNRYSSMEAALIHHGGLEPPTLRGLFHSDPLSRRRSSKVLFYRLPFRPLLVFLALYVFRGGFLDGKAGLAFCLLRSYYEFMINCKLEELRRRDRGLPV